MKKLIFILAVLLAVTFLALQAQSVVFISGTSGGGACSTSISDDFSGTLSKWAELGTSGNWAIVSGQAKVTDKSVLIYTDEQTCVAGTQWAMTKIDMSLGAVYGGLYFRSQNDATTYAYVVRYEEPNDDFVWRYCGGAANSDVASNCTNVGTWFNHVLDDGDYYGIEVAGTGTGTEVKIYDLGTTAINYSNWASSADSVTTLTDDPGQAADTGKYIGLYSGATGDIGFDDFSGGSE